MQKVCDILQTDISMTYPDSCSPQIAEDPSLVPGTRIVSECDIPMYNSYPSPNTTNRVRRLVQGLDKFLKCMGGGRPKKGKESHNVAQAQRFVAALADVVSSSQPFNFASLSKLDLNEIGRKYFAIHWHINDRHVFRLRNLYRRQKEYIDERMLHLQLSKQQCELKSKYMDDMTKGDEIQHNIGLEITERRVSDCSLQDDDGLVLLESVSDESDCKRQVRLILVIVFLGIPIVKETQFRSMMSSMKLVSMIKLAYKHRILPLTKPVN